MNKTAQNLRTASFVEESFYSKIKELGTEIEMVLATIVPKKKKGEKAVQKVTIIDLPLSEIKDTDIRNALKKKN